MTAIMIPMQDPSARNRAAQVISEGKLIVFPTDTLYGLACDPLNPKALAAIYAVKHRSPVKALPVLIGDLKQLDYFVQKPTPTVEGVIRHFWPGALTAVLPKLDNLPDVLSPYPGLAVRMPNHTFARRLMRGTGPLAVTSANLSGGENLLTAGEVLAQVGDSVELVIDGGSMPSNIGSTVVDLCGMEPVLLRQGPIPFDEILTVWYKYA